MEKREETGELHPERGSVPSRRERGVAPKVTGALLDAQRIAFAPVIFAVAKAVRDQGILQAIRDGGKAGSSCEAIAEETGLPLGGVKMLVEAAAAFGLVTGKGEGGPPRYRYRLTKVGFFTLVDRMTRLNMDFVADVCFGGLAHLQEAVATEKPAGLRVFGQWSTIYEGLSQLPPDVLESWLTFDHYYSDSAFPDALPIVLNAKPARVLDVGGNTGRFAIACCRADSDVEVTIADHEGQLALAREKVDEAGVGERVHGHPTDLLDPTRELPRGFDTLWMSQFLVCFSDAEVGSILRRAREAMGPTTTLWILETFWDAQENDIAKLCLEGMSPYFICMANGNSRVYSEGDFVALIEAAGLTVAERHEHLGRGHTLLGCRQASSAPA